MLKKGKEAVSPVIAVILMVAITVVLAAVLFVMVSELTDRDVGTELALGRREGAHTDEYWVVEVVERSAHMDGIYFQLQEDGAALYSNTSYEARVLPTSGDNATVPSENRPIVWIDNDNNEALNGGDRIRISKEGLEVGRYQFLALKAGSVLFTIDLTIHP